MKKPFFTVIIPTYNRKKFLKIAIASVLEQTFADYELLIIDDGSSDGTETMLKDFKDQRLKYFYQKQKGVSSARNKGIKQAQGKFIAFLDSDDRFCRQKLEINSAYIKDHPEYKIFHSEEIWYKNGQLLAQKAYHKKPEGIIFSDSLKLCCVSPSTVAIEKNIFKEIGPFDENLPACEDYDLWLRITAKYPVFLIPQYLTIKEGGHPNQQSKKYPAMDKFRIYALSKLIKSNALTQSQYKLAYQELKNKCFIFKKGALKRAKVKEAAYCEQVLKELSPK
jgi:glycosyltransferase involved in cell wall biosynthesis